MTLKYDPETRRYKLRWPWNHSLGLGRTIQYSWFEAFDNTGRSMTSPNMWKNAYGRDMINSLFKAIRAI